MVTKSDNAEITNIVKAIIQNNNYVIDDDAPVDTSFKIKYLGLIDAGEEEYTIPVFENSLFPETVIYLDKNNLPHMHMKRKKIISTVGIGIFDLMSVNKDIVFIMEL